MFGLATVSGYSTVIKNLSLKYRAGVHQTIGMVGVEPTNYLEYSYREITVSPITRADEPHLFIPMNLVSVVGLEPTTST